MMRRGEEKRREEGWAITPSVEHTVGGGKDILSELG
jgi:hypothetical protein